MIFGNHNCPIKSQISSARDDISILMTRVRSMEDCLESPDLPDDKREEIERELVEIKKLLQTNKEILAEMHKSSSHSYVVAVFLFFSFVVYFVYCLSYGR